MSKAHIVGWAHSPFGKLEHEGHGRTDGRVSSVLHWPMQASRSAMSTASLSAS